ncbi:hypothetical protein H0H81_000982 [Sphagnurus paluster]|uniref:AB hydrolase-1 domain-containing protein n=1 Tax=Sphagnurus paluster TaxID=117069 RepID=A0A9P7GIQ9_9AGAR|nr:hypothetical protein H0H81_000982 [Sphagnurus paluster]
MDSSLYKSLTTSRNLKYSYYYSVPVVDKPVILFVHGFPNTANDWRHQVNFFKDQGYGIIAPDMLGYGDTDKPADHSQYTLSALARDVIDILDAEKVDKAIAIGHDWGSILVSRIANYHPDRFLAFAFLAVGYVGHSDATFDQFHAFTAKLATRELFGYWYYFGEEDAHKTIENNFDSFYSLLMADDSALTAATLGPVGGFQTWVESDKKTAIASYLSEEEVKAHKQVLLQGGLQGPLNWYKVRTTGLDIEDGKALTPEQKLVHQPVFFGGATQDEICIPAMGKAGCAQFVKGPLTVKEFNAGHWLIWQVKDELNQALLEWVQGL